MWYNLILEPVGCVRYFASYASMHNTEKVFCNLDEKQGSSQIVFKSIKIILSVFVQGYNCHAEVN